MLRSIVGTLAMVGLSMVGGMSCTAPLCQVDSDQPECRYLHAPVRLARNATAPFMLDWRDDQQWQDIGNGAQVMVQISQDQRGPVTLNATAQSQLHLTVMPDPAQLGTLQNGPATLTIATGARSLQTSLILYTPPQFMMPCTYAANNAIGVGVGSDPNSRFGSIFTFEPETPSPPPMPPSNQWQIASHKFNNNTKCSMLTTLDSDNSYTTIQPLTPPPTSAAISAHYIMSNVDDKSGNHMKELRRYAKNGTSMIVQPSRQDSKGILFADPNSDLVAVQTDSGLICFNVNAANYMSPLSLINFPNPTLKYLAVGDINGDMRSDVLVLDDSAAAYILLQDEAGELSFDSKLSMALTKVLSTISANLILAAALSDIDGDHYLDLILILNQSQQASAAVVAGHGDGTFEAPYYPMSFGSAPGSVAAFVVSDVNGDGAPDLMLTTIKNSSNYQVQFFLNQANYMAQMAPH